MHSESSTKTGRVTSFTILAFCWALYKKWRDLTHLNLRRSGFIDLAEFVELMRYLNVQMSHDDASAVFMVLDSNGDGEMSQREFEDYWVANMQNTRL